MRLSDFDYNLPETVIANFPPTVRGTSRLLVLDRTTGQLTHRHYADLVDYLHPDDVLILNDTKVIKARLIVKDKNNNDKEIFLLEKHHNELSTNTRTTLVLHRGTLRVNDILKLNSANLHVIEDLGNGIIKLKSDTDLDKLADTAGQVPLPPYIKRATTSDDEHRYQTVFAQHRGSVAAPTASLNLTEELLEKLRAKGVRIHYLTLHVGLGTFLPIRTDDLTHHQMHSEFFSIPQSTVQAIQTAKHTHRQIVALGTTVTRALESAHHNIFAQPPHEISGEADIFIYPGFRFKIIDKLITNFHAPQSTVLILTAAFAGWNKLKPAYETAIQHQYKFLSYGDSMLIF